MLFLIDSPGENGSLTFQTLADAPIGLFTTFGPTPELDLVLRLNNKLDLNPPPTLDVDRIGISLLDSSLAYGNTSDSLFFQPGMSLETTPFFADPPTEVGATPESVIWDNGLLMADDPPVPGVFEFRLFLDPVENFGGGNGIFSLNLRLDVHAVDSQNTIPEPSTLLGAAALMVLPGYTLWRRRRPR